MKINFVVKVLNGYNTLTAGYVKEIDMEFVPVVGMKIKRSAASTWLWETENGNELSPQIKEVVYNIDEEKIYCLFEIHELLVASFWKEIPNDHLNGSFELSQFEVN